MNEERALLARYFRQLREFGERELVFDSLTAEEVLELLRGERAATPAKSTAPAVSTAPAPAASGSRTGLTVLAEEVAGCAQCRLHEGRSSTVFGEGAADADVMVVGEAPGAEEDRTGRPFVGPAGKLLDLLLLTVGFPRDWVYICNVLKCRPPGNRDPQADEVERCSPYLKKQIELIAPRAIIAVGKFAAQTLSEKELPIGKLRGQIHRYQDVPVIATFHPAFLLRSPQWTRSAWQDFQLLRQVVDEQV